MPHPRFTVLTITEPNGDPGSVVFDTQTGRCSWGVYATYDIALDVAASNEEQAAPLTPQTPRATAFAAWCASTLRQGRR
jgi:hypothetical protein